ncbi:MAG: protein tyrosine phosphatase [Candidatus Methylomirabilia bacterium]
MKFLFICTGNVSRSPAAEKVLSQISQNAHETRSAGVSVFCARPVAEKDVRWADVVAVMEDAHRIFVVKRWPDVAPKVRVLDIEDRYHRHDPELRHLLEVKLGTLLSEFESGGIIGA